MSGRARGRSRGRSRGSGTPQEEPLRRPGEEQQRAQQPSAAAAAPTPVGATSVAGSGRASYRGGVAAPRPGAGDAPRAPVEEMAQLRVGTGDARQVGKKRADFRYTDVTTRPAHITDKRGNSGTPLPLATNFFTFDCDEDWSLYQYHVDFNPMIDSRKMKAGLLFTHAELLGATRVFDGMILYLPRKLPQEVTEVFSQTRRDNENIRITIKLTNTFHSTSPQCLHLYNVIFKRILNLIEMQQIGRNYYNMDLAVDITQHKLRVVPGFITSILQYENKAMLCADISHKIMRIDTVLDMMYALYNSTDRSGDSFYEKCTKKFVGSIVLTRYNNKTYRVDDIDWDIHPTSSFTRREGEITFKEYYKKAYDKDIEDDLQPMLVSRAKPKEVKMGRPETLLLVPELCILTGLSDDVRSDFSVMRDVASHTRIAPEGRVNTLSGFMNQINSTPKVVEELRGWRLRFSQNLLQLGGRVLPKEQIFLASNAQCNYKQEDADWSRDLRGKQLVTSVPLQNWVICFTRRDSGNASDLVNTLCKVGPPMGMSIGNPTLCELNDDRSSTFLDNMKKFVNQNTQLVMCILPTNRKDRYDAIKKACCVDHPVASQCVVARTLSKKQMLMSVATKIAIQLNCKLGGEVWRLDIPLKNLMVIGIDTYHDSASKGRSVGGVVCSINRNITRFYSRCTFQHTAQELNDGLKVCVKDALKKYHEVNNMLPDKIVIFRDGVGDGQLPAVHEHEVPQVVGTIKECAGEDYNVKIAVVVVKKRINSRFFAKTGRTYTNPVPGTVIDTEVTKPEWFDFFLVSQSVRQGTVTPTHFNVIFDTTGLKPDHMQRLTYKMTHLYYNWPGTIRVPAPCQYAHKLAFLVGQSIHKEPALDLADRLYFL
ncbi:piwi-like protein 1 [Mizuhopecten yessoensis]|uniref:Piwi-like protein 1 n=1 Tax=Mizuhopecten yessoensis TaxID=6573 RepID=A0A210PYP0_MIZYE|nr:piwi-like protein 1 [Mizuhopecten yessoensis]XP_021371710.1 piwi-like protein 1 [Mizuhopecten yessoensis]XP_021371711.1 piwi-like protein 1 [Mizuhopecten yessoensis]XP_021371712.1 piwi-like protein 1 [Mizuhopecten yessoensis]OWF41593.1 Piwi-like protein 1 [Mizuhopecten yessoensis]